MKILAFIGVFMSLFSAHARPISPVESVYRSTSLRGGIGFDKQIIQLFGTEEEFTGVYFLRIDVRQRKLTNYRLPRATFTNYCGHYRESGGSIGDFKPKSIYRTIRILHEASGWEDVVFAFGQSGRDYNENPVQLNFNEFHPRGTKISLDPKSEVMTMLIDKCRNMRPVPHFQMTWQTAHSCRWKPEIWHKPAPWSEEYVTPIRTRLTRNVHLQCVNL